MATATLRKAAVFLASLPKGQASVLLEKLTPQQASAVFSEMAALGQIDCEEQATVMREFAASEPFLAEKDCTADAALFAFLYDLDADNLLSLIGGEHPQTIAMILSQLPARQAADAIAALPPVEQTSIISRIAAMDQPSPEVIADVAEAIRCRISGPVSVPISRGMSRVVKMFGAMRPATERKLLGGIAQADPNLLMEIRRAMFGPDVAACGPWNVSGEAC